MVGTEYLNLIQKKFVLHRVNMFVMCSAIEDDSKAETLLILNLK
jgi:hypothetical protein